MKKDTIKKLNDVLEIADDIIDIEGLDDASAGKLIMQARAHWFEDDAS